MREAFLEYGNAMSKLFPDVVGVTKDKFNDSHQGSKTVTFQVTEKCNLNCTYCYEINKHPNMMTIETAKKFIDGILENRHNPDYFINEENTRILIIEFFGGEPLLNMDVVEFVTDYFERFFTKHPECPWSILHKYSFSSNGTLYMTDRVQAYMNKYRHLISDSITVDGCKEAHDACRKFYDGSPSYDLAIESALEALKYGNDSTKITLAPSNIKYFYQSVVNMVELGFTNIGCNCAFEEGWVTEDAKNLYAQSKMIADYIHENDLYDEIYVKMLDPKNYTPISEDQKDRSWCGTTGCMLALQPSGKIFTCCRFMDTSLGKDCKSWAIGHVDHGIGYTDDEKENIKILSEVTTRSQSEEKCLDCPISSNCSYCVAYNYQYYKEFKRTTFICECTIASAIASKYLTKIVGDKEAFDKINIPDDWALKIVSEDEWNMVKTF